MSARSGSVLYVSFESGDALGLRTQALRDRGLDMKHFHLIRASDPISPAIERDRTESPSPGEAKLAATIRQTIREIEEKGEPPVVLLIIDTIRASLSGSEDLRDGLGLHSRTATAHGAGARRRVHRGPPLGVAGREVKKKRERGSSDFRGTADAVLLLRA